MSRLKVAVVFGGSSEEHAVSVKSAQEVAMHLDLEKYEPLYIGITNAGAWNLCVDPHVEWETASPCPAILSPETGVHGLLLLQTARYETIRVDVMFSVLHGKLGEDGAIQGLFELAGIPYVGCNVQSSTLCLDKSLAYLVAESAGIATPKFWIVGADEDSALDGLTYPVFVKPARSGSSFGVTKVSREQELRSALEVARQYDSKVLIEQAVAGIEVGARFLGTTRICSWVQSTEWRSHTASSGFIRRKSRKRVQKTQRLSFPLTFRLKRPGSSKRRPRRCTDPWDAGDWREVDLFLKEDGSVLLNEVNTLPGLTSYSRYPRMMAAQVCRFPK